MTTDPSANLKKPSLIFWNGFDHPVGLHNGSWYWVSGHTTDTSWYKWIDTLGRTTYKNGWEPMDSPRGLETLTKKCWDVDIRNPARENEIPQGNVDTEKKIDNLHDFMQEAGILPDSLTGSTLMKLSPTKMQELFSIVDPVNDLLIDVDDSGFSVNHGNVGSMGIRYDF